MKKWPLIAFFSKLLLVCFVGVTTGQSANLGKVTGSVFDHMDALIPGVEITVSRGSFAKTVRSDFKGAYEIELVPGVYDVQTKQNWWFPVRRAVFVVRSNQTAIINLQPRSRDITQELVATKKGLEDRYTYGAQKPKYEDFRPFADSEVNVVIEYTKRRTHGRLIEFSGAVLTYDATSVSADKIRLDKKNLRVEAEGNVIIDLNGERKKLTAWGFSIERTHLP